MNENKFFLEHKNTHRWLTYSGDLTNNPSESSIIDSKDEWIIQKWLSPIKIDVVSDYSGKYYRKDEGTIFMQSLQHMIIEKLKALGINLFTDFIIKEHEFINPS